ncbi:MAG: nucleotide sugar dehydrogenase [Candidatus Omnitrophota bacterium]|jgi:UDP-N-acetyl-D-glucosamine dehydrogenase
MERNPRDLKDRIQRREIRIAVVGLGYVGLPLALAFAKKGLDVLGVEIDKNRLGYLKRKKSYITDVEDDELRRPLVKKRFKAVSDFAAVRSADVIIICVPTPLKRKYHPDISYIKQAVKSVARYMKRGSLVILESTTYPGTTEEVILPLLEKSGFRHNRDFYLVFSPERIDPGNQAFPVDKIPKIIGGLSREATDLAALVYGKIIEKVVPVSSAKVAEVVKLLENTFRLINIGLIDELAMMAHKMKVDIWEVVKAASTKPFGFMPFYPGPGVGGHCIPKDPLYLYWKARKHHGFSSRFIKLASGVITGMPEYIVTRIEEILNKDGISLNQARILIIGVTYKKDIRDLRQSPALDIIDILQKRGAFTGYYDPLIPYLKINHINLQSIELNKKNLNKFDCAVITADHSSLDYAFILKNSRFILDTRNVYQGIKDRRVSKL